MKVEVHVTCTPEEARQFLGLPDVSDMQKQMVDIVYGRMSENIKTMDTNDLMGTWVPFMMQGWSDAQKGFWEIMQQTAATPNSASKAKAQKL